MNELLPKFNELFRIWLPNILTALVILFAFWVLYRIVLTLIDKSEIRFKLDSHQVLLIRSTIRITLFVFGIITALGTLGVNISAMVAGLGLTGFALGFALKDTISNLLSGVLILFYRPFQVGHVIKFDKYEGKVIGIDLRYTILDGADGKVLIPNSKLFTDPITVLRTEPDTKP